MPLVSSYTPWKHQKTSGFSIFFFQGVQKERPMAGNGFKRLKKCCEDVVDSFRPVMDVLQLSHKKRFEYSSYKNTSWEFREKWIKDTAGSTDPNCLSIRRFPNLKNYFYLSFNEKRKLGSGGCFWKTGCQKMIVNFPILKLGRGYC